MTLLSLTAVHAEEQKPAAKVEPAATPATTAPNVTPDEVEKILKEKGKEVIILDVRTPEEFAGGHIAGAINADFFDDAFKQKLSGLDKSKTVVLHCAAGGRSGRALKVLQEANFTHLLHMNGGMNAWSAAGKPVEK